MAPLSRQPIQDPLSKTHGISGCMTARVVIEIREHVESFAGPVGEPLGPRVESRVGVAPAVFPGPVMKADTGKGADPWLC